MWPLATILLVGALLIGGAIWGASRLLLGPSPEAKQRAEQTAVVVRLTTAVRLVTPTGSEEVRLSPHPCQPGDSGQTYVERELHFDRTFDQRALTEQVISAYVARGWTRDPTHDGMADSGTRYVHVIGEPTRRGLLIDAFDGADEASC